MSTKHLSLFTLLLLSTILLSSCAFRMGGPNGNPQTGQSLAAQSTSGAEDVVASPTARPTRTPRATRTPASAQNVDEAQLEQAKQAARAYFTAVSEGNSKTAADLASNYSLMVHQMTRGDAESALQAQKIAGTRWSDLQIQDVKLFDPKTALVHVTYLESQKTAEAALTPTATVKASGAAAPTAAAQTGKTAVPTATADLTATAAAPTTKDELWAFRLENGDWRYNWNNLIDFHTLQADSQTVHGVTVLPVQIKRYTDRIALNLLVQNRTNEPVVFGQVNETLGAFHFGDQPVVAEKTRWILNPLRSDPNISLEAKGLFQSYPDSVEIRKWNNYDVKPWYVFQLN
jgi:hypothetical protein